VGKVPNVLIGDSFSDWEYANSFDDYGFDGYGFDAYQ